MRIFAGGIATETNTFAPVPTSLEDFRVQRGSDAPNGEPSCGLIFNVWRRQAQTRGDDFVFGLMASAEPSGITVRTAYESLRDELLRDLQTALPVDLVLLVMHGAMVAQGYDDCEEDIIGRVRQIVGSRVVLGVELDLHCHLSAAKIAQANLIVTYKEYPHTDRGERARELFDLAVEVSLGRLHPTVALFDCRMIGLYPTSRQPMRNFVNAMSAAERRSGVRSVSFGHGFQFADLPHVGSKVLVITDDDPALAKEVARDLGIQVYKLRREISFDRLSLPMEPALLKALAATKFPVVVADQSDNTGGGAPGDATFALRWLLARQAEDIATAILYDPEVVKIAQKAGVGATLPVRLGGKMSVHSGDPLDIEVTVLGIRENYLHLFPQQSGEPAHFAAGTVAALRCGTIDIVVGTERCQCVSPSIFSDLGIDPMRKRLLIPKSVQHFYGAFAPIAAEVIYMAASGAVPPDPRLISYRRLCTNEFYPWADNPLGID